MILVDADGVAAAHPGKPLFAGLSLTISSGDRVGVVGLNASGKSTLLQILAGSRPPDAGVVRRGRDARVSFLDQDAPLPPGTVAEVAGEGWEVAAVLDRLGMGALGDAPLHELSGGQRKRVALARVLLAVSGTGHGGGGGAGTGDEGDLLLLDEPTNHLDLDAIAWLEDRLAGFRGGLVLVTHDRHVLDRLTNRVVELERGGWHAYDGGYQAWLEARAQRAEREAAAEARRRNLARSELAWLRRGAPARTRKPAARVAAAREVIEARAPTAERAGALPLHVDTPRLGDQVVELRGVGDGYGGRWLFRGLDLALDRRERLGIVGANGSGKSTLLQVLAGRRAPREGTVVHGPTVRLATFDQHGADLDPRRRVLDAVAGPARQPDWRDTRLLEAFWFDDNAQHAPIGDLSGGERRRVQLLLALAQRPNVLLLDEPTNDLDLDTLRSLEDFLEAWPGALVVVSHDRSFLERTVTDVIVLDGSGRAGRWPGGYEAWHEQRRASRPAGGRRARAATSDPGPAPSVAPRGADRRAGPSPSTLRHRLREAEKALRALERRRAQLEADVAAAGDDHEHLARAGRALADVLAEQHAAEERWLELAAALEERR